MSGLPQTITRGPCLLSDAPVTTLYPLTHWGQLLQSAIAQQLRDALAEFAGTRLTGHRAEITQLRLGLGKRRLLCHVGNFIAVGEIAGMAHAMQHNQSIKRLPYGGIAQYRDKRADPGTAGQQPQIAPRRQLIDGEETEAGLVDCDFVADAKHRQLL